MNATFEASGQAWLEIDTTANFLAGGNTFIDTYTFHAGGTGGATVSGTFTLDPTGWNRMAVSYDPVNHLAAASLNGQVIATLPYATTSIKYVGVEGSWFATVNNFTVQSGSVTPATPAALSSTQASTQASTFSQAKVSSLASATLDASPVDALPA